jgi:hypothetical protein
VKIACVSANFSLVATAHSEERRNGLCDDCIDGVAVFSGVTVLQRDQAINAADCQLVSHRLQISTGRNRFKKCLGPRHRLGFRQTLEDPILQSREPFRHAEFDRVARMVIIFERATNGAPLPVIPTNALRDSVCCSVGADAG